MKDTCYVLTNGECVSPLPCEHGDGLPLEEFVRIIEKPLKDEIKGLNVQLIELRKSRDTTVQGYD